MTTELGLRAALALRGTPYAASKTQSYARSLLRSTVLSFGQEPASERTDRLQLHPYLGFTHDGLDTALLAASRKSEGRSWMVVGGSVAAGFAIQLGPGVSGRDPFNDRPLNVLHCATAGHKQPQQMHAVAHAFSLGLRPDLVINLDGFNEVALGNDNHAGGIDPSQPSRGHWLGLATQAGSSTQALTEAGRLFQRTDELRSVIDAAERRHWFRSAVLGSLTMNRIRTLRSDVLRRRARYQTMIHAGGAPPHLVGPRRSQADPVQRSAEIWEESSRAIARLCASYDCEYVHILQPTLHDPGSKPMTPEEHRNGVLPETWLEGVRRGYPLLRKGLADLEDEGILVLDASGLFAQVEQTLYTDGCHFDNKGYAILVRSLCDFLIAARDEGRISFE